MFVIAIRNNVNGEVSLNYQIYINSVKVSVS